MIGAVDSHAHLCDFFDSEEIEQILNRALKVGVVCVIDILSAVKFRPPSYNIPEGMDIYYAVGVHPHDAASSPSTEVIERYIKDLGQKVIAIGEIGLDYHYMNSPSEVQKRVFVDQLRLAKRLRLPVIVHSRDALEDTASILKDYKESRVLLHCYSYGIKGLSFFNSENIYYSFSGIVTFKNVKDHRLALKKVQENRILVETDSPFLAPQPKRGKRNEPAYVVHTIKKIADELGLSVVDVARITRKNAFKFFNIQTKDSVEIVYPIRNSLYINLTNSCTLACRFCGKRRDYTVKGHFLKLLDDPSVYEIRQELLKKNFRSYDEVVFCGYGEPTKRLKELIEIARWIKEQAPDIIIRLNTDGLANLIYGRDVTEDLSKFVDVVSVSLNASDAKTYAKICPSKYGESAFDHVCEFILKSKRRFKEVIATAVGLPDLDIDAIRRFAEERLGVKFRLRRYNELG